jgi:hypothetical protein
VGGVLLSDKLEAQLAELHKLREQGLWASFWVIRAAICWGLLGMMILLSENLISKWRCIS